MLHVTPGRLIASVAVITLAACMSYSQKELLKELRELASKDGIVVGGASGPGTFQFQVGDSHSFLQTLSAPMFVTTISSDGRVIAGPSEHGARFIVFSLDEQRVIGSFALTEYSGQARLALTREGTRLAICGQFQAGKQANFGVKTFSVLSGLEERSYPLPSTRQGGVTCGAMSWHPSGRSLAIGTGFDICEIDTSTGNIKCRIRGGLPAWSASGESIAYRTEEGYLGLWSSQGPSERILERIQIRHFLRWSPDDSYLVFAESTTFGVRTVVYRVRDGNSASLGTSLKVGHSTGWLRLDPQAVRAVTLSTDK